MVEINEGKDIIGRVNKSEENKKMCKYVMGESSQYAHMHVASVITRL